MYTDPDKLRQKRTRSAVLWSSIFNEPLTAIYPMLPIIMNQELYATLLQLGIFYSLKPVVSLFSLHWSHWVNQRQDLLIPNVVWGGILARLPFFLFPFIQNSWFVLLAAATYWMFFRGTVPAWMEILKLNLPSERRTRVYAYGAVVGYAIGVGLAFIVGPWMDSNHMAWKWIYPIFAAISMVGVFFQARVPLAKNGYVSKIPIVSLKERLVAPWKNVFTLLKKRPDFSRFQWGIMISGFAIMLMKPVEPVIVNSIELSYTDIAVAFLIFKALGYVVTTPLWVRWMGRSNIFVFTSIIFFLIALCYLTLAGAFIWTQAVFVAYFLYGVWLAGNHLSWNLSGPIFSSGEDSSAYTGVSVAAVGLRGLVGPSLGSLLLFIGGTHTVLTIGISLSVLSGVLMLFWGKRYPIVGKSLL